MRKLNKAVSLFIRIILQANIIKELLIYIKKNCGSIPVPRPGSKRSGLNKNAPADLVFAPTPACWKVRS